MRGEERYRSSAMKVGDERETVLPSCRFGDHLRIWTKDGQGQMLRRHESAQLGGGAVPRKLDVNETDSNPVRPQTMSIDPGGHRDDRVVAVTEHFVGNMHPVDRRRIEDVPDPAHQSPIFSPRRWLAPRCR